jgi:cell division protein FtsL
MNIFNIIEIICTIAAAVCLVVALVLVVVSEFKARKLRREIESALKNKENSDG